jgi:hypothetical protein
MRLLAFYVTATLKGSSKGYFICIFKIATNRQAAG